MQARVYKEAKHAREKIIPDGLPHTNQNIIKINKILQYFIRYAKNEQNIVVFYKIRKKYNEIQ